MNGERRPPDDHPEVLVGFMVCAFSGAIMGALIVGLAWWLT